MIPLRIPQLIPSKLPSSGAMQMVNVSNGVATINIPSGRTWTRLAMPADITGSAIWDTKLEHWNTRLIASSSKANPWVAGNILQGNDRIMGSTNYISGSSIVLEDLTYTRFLDHPFNGQTVVQRNWSHDKVNHKYSYEFYLDNDLQKVSATTISSCDATTNWSVQNGIGVVLGNDTSDKQEGTGSLYNSTTGTADGSGYLAYNYTSALNLTGTEFIEFWIKSDITGNMFCQIFDNSANYKLWYGSRFPIAANTWTRFVLPLLAPQGSTGSLPNIAAGTLDITNIANIYIGINGVGALAACTLHIDDVCADVGQWVKVEAYVPDNILNSTSAVNLSSWDGSVYDTPYFSYNPNNGTKSIGTNQRLHYLDGTTGYSIEGGDVDGYDVYNIGNKTQSRNSLYGWATAITYSSNYGCQKRIGWALKMPPDDGKDSSTTGISQVRLKLEVYYDSGTNSRGETKYGMTTYEFENSTNQYYGLQNLNDSWIALFDITTGNCDIYVFSRRPTAFTVRADENELIDQVVVTLPIGSQAYKLTSSITASTTDTNSDGVPNFLDSSVSGSVPNIVNKMFYTNWP